MARYQHPCRYGLAFEDWPGVDRAAWARATEQGEILEPSGAAAHWRPKTRKQVIKGYGQWLRFCLGQGALDPQACPGARITREDLTAYIESLRARVAPVTVVSRLTDLSEAIRVMEPRADRSLLRLAVSRLQAMARPSRNKAGRLVDARTLYEAGISQMEDLLKVMDLKPQFRATLFRDALLVALLAAQPALRPQNLAQIRLGIHLRKQGGTLVPSPMPR